MTEEDEFRELMSRDVNPGSRLHNWLMHPTEAQYVRRVWLTVIAFCAAVIGGFAWWMS